MRRGSRRIVTSVPNSAFVDISSAVAEHVEIPVVASNRINMPQAAEQILADTHVQLISMARPLLSDPNWVAKAQADAADEINTCISCNQACLDHAFVHKKVSCLLNPRAGRETDLVLSPTRRTRRVAVVGAGPAGSGRRGDRRRTRPRGDAVRGRRCHRRPIRHGEKDSRQGGVQRDHPLLHPDARQARRRRAAEHPRRRRGTGRSTTKWCWRPAWRRGCPTSPASTIRWCCRTPRRSWASRSERRWPSSARAASGSTSASSW